MLKNVNGKAVPHTPHKPTSLKPHPHLRKASLAHSQAQRTEGLTNSLYHARVYNTHGSGRQENWCA